MPRTGVLVLACAFGAMILSALVGCAAGASATAGGAEEGSAPGEKGGTCLPDGSCDPGLECLDGACEEVEGEGEGDDGEGEGEGDGDGEGDTLLIFHNSSGPMCLAALDWLDSVKSQHPALVVEEHLTYEAGETELLAQLEAQFQSSQGVSTSFEYLPIVFFRGQAFSGFNDEVARMLEELLPAAAADSS